MILEHDEKAPKHATYVWVPFIANGTPNVVKKWEFCHVTKSPKKHQKLTIQKYTKVSSKIGYRSYTVMFVWQRTVYSNEWCCYKKVLQKYAKVLKKCNSPALLKCEWCLKDSVDIMPPSTKSKLASTKCDI